MTEIETNVADAWLKSGAIQITERGEENEYYVDIFDRVFFCKRG